MQKKRMSFVVTLALVIIALVIPSWMAATAYDYGKKQGYQEGSIDYFIDNESRCQMQMQEQLQNYKEDMAVLKARCGDN